MAVEHWGQVIRLQPANADALLNLAGSYDKMGRRDKAIACLEEAFDLARSGGNVSLVRQIAAQLRRDE